MLGPSTLPTRRQVFICKEMIRELGISVFFALGMSNLEVIARASPQAIAVRVADIMAMKDVASIGRLSTRVEIRVWRDRSSATRKSHESRGKATPHFASPALVPASLFRSTSAQ